MNDKKNKAGAGRPKGVPNKITALNKECITEFLSAYRESGLMAKDFALLEPKDRLSLAEKLMQYTMPKIQSVAVDLNATVKNKTIEDELARLAKDPTDTDND